MIYFTAGDLHVIVLESANLEELKKGRPAVTQDKQVMLCWTPDPVWLVDKIQDAGGDLKETMRLIQESSKRPQQPHRKYHKPAKINFAEDDKNNGG